MKHCKFFRTAMYGAIVGSLTVALKAQNTPSSAPETVLATYRVKQAQIEAFLKLMPEYWLALRKDGLVLVEPHLLLRGEESGGPIIVEVFSWRDHDAPEHVPPEIQAYWGRLNSMVEDRAGHKGIEFPEMTIVSSKGQ